MCLMSSEVMSFSNLMSFYFVSITAGLAIPTSAQGMFCLGEKKKKKQEIEIIKVQNCSTN